LGARRLAARVAADAEAARLARAAILLPDAGDAPVLPPQAGAVVLSVGEGVVLDATAELPRLDAERVYELGAGLPWVIDLGPTTGLVPNELEQVSAPLRVALEGLDRRLDAAEGAPGQRRRMLELHADGSLDSVHVRRVLATVRDAGWSASFRVSTPGGARRLDYRFPPSGQEDDPLARIGVLQLPFTLHLRADGAWAGRRDQDDLNAARQGAEQNWPAIRAHLVRDRDFFPAEEGAVLLIDDGVPYGQMLRALGELVRFEYQPIWPTGGPAVTVATESPAAGETSRPLLSPDPGAAPPQDATSTLPAPGPGGTAGKVSAAGEPAIRGDLDVSLVHAVVQRHVNQLRYCYARALQAEPSLGGRITVNFVVASDGTVSSAKTASSSLANPAVESCVNQRFLRFQFPDRPGSGVVTVSYPLAFSPG
jgi:hypothetical protein